MKQYLMEINGQTFVMNVQDVGDGQTYLIEHGGVVRRAVVHEEPMDLQERINRAISELPAPVINVNVPPQAPPVVHVMPPQVNVNIPDIRLQAGSVARVKRDYTGKIVAIDSTAQVTGE